MEENTSWSSVLRTANLSKLQLCFFLSSIGSGLSKLRQGHTPKPRATIPNNEIFDCYCGSSGCWCRKRVSIERLCFRGPKDGVPSRLQVCWKRLFSHYRLLFLLLQPIAAGSRHYRLALALRLLYSDELMFAQQLRSMLSQIQHHLLWEGEDSRRPTQKAAALSLKM